MKLLKILLPLALCLMLLAGCGQAAQTRAENESDRLSQELAGSESYENRPYQDLSLGELADPERIVLSEDGQEKAVFEKGSDEYEHLTTMIRSLIDTELDRNEAQGILGRKLDQTMLYMDVNDGTYLTYEYPAGSYTPVYFFISDYPDDLLVSLATDDPRCPAGPYAFIGVQEVRDYLNSL